MAFIKRNIFITIGLLLIFGVSLAVFSSPERKTRLASKTARTIPTKVSFKLLSQADGEVIVEWTCPDYKLERDSATGLITGISMKGAAPMHETGAPELPSLCEALDCLPGSVQAAIMEIEETTVPLGDVAVQPKDILIDRRDDQPDPSSVSLDNLPATTITSSWRERSAATPPKTGLWPQKSVELGESGIYRGHRLMGLKFFPVRVNMQERIAKVASRVKIRITMPRNETATSRIPDLPHETTLVRNLLGTLASTAQPTRMPNAFEGRAESRSQLDDLATGKSWKLYVNSETVVMVTGAYLKEAKVPIEEITTYDLHVTNRGNEVPIHFSGDGDGTFEEADFFEFYGTPNYKTFLSYSPSLYNDPWSDENVYIMSWGSGRPGLRMAEENGAWNATWPNNPLYTVRTRIHYEQDSKYERLALSYANHANTLATQGPLGIYEDHWFDGVPIQGGTSRDFLIPFNYPDDGPINPITVRVSLQGLSIADAVQRFTGDHRVTIYVNGNTTYGLTVGRTDTSDTEPAWKGQTPKIVSTGFRDSTLTNEDLVNGTNVVTVTLPGDGIDGLHDRVSVNWIEIEYNRIGQTSRVIRSSGAGLKFMFDERRGDTVSVTVSGFANRDISVWKLGRSRFTGHDVYAFRSPTENSSWTTRFQLISDDAYDVLVFDNYYRTEPRAIRPVVSTQDLRAINGAQYVMVVSDTLMRNEVSMLSLARLDSLRRATFNGSVLQVSDQEIYEQFNYGITNPEAIRQFFKYGYENWPERPTHACIIGDGVMEAKYMPGRKDYIPSFYPLTTGIGVCAADMFFGCVAGPPWDMIPDIAVGRISCRPTNNCSELQGYVEKLIQYEGVSDYRSLYRVTMCFVADLTDPDFRFDLGFSEPALRLVRDDINITRVYLDTIAVQGGGIGQAPNVLRDAMRSGAAIVNYNGHGGGGVWSGTLFMTVSGVSLLNNRRVLPFITNFTCYVGSFDDASQSAVLGEAFIFGKRATNGDNVGGIAVYSTSGVGWAYAGLDMQLKLFDFIADPPAKTLGEIVQINKTRYWLTYGQGQPQFGNYLDTQTMMNLLGDPGAKLAIVEDRFQPELYAINDTLATDNVVRADDRLRISGTIPWEPSADNPADLYGLPYNGLDTRYAFDTRDSVWYSYFRASHVPAYDQDNVTPLTISTRDFVTAANTPIRISTQFATPEGHVVVYAVDPVRRLDAVGVFPIYLADSVNGLQVLNVMAYPKGYIESDSAFKIQATILDTLPIQRVRLSGVFTPAQGEFILDTVDMVSEGAGLWRTPFLDARDVHGSTYRARFLITPQGGSTIQSRAFPILIQQAPDFAVFNNSDTKPELRAGDVPFLRVPIENKHPESVMEVPELTVRVMAISDTVIGSGADTTRVIIDSFISDAIVRNVQSLGRLFEAQVPMYFQPRTYRLTIQIDPANLIPEVNDLNNSLTVLNVRPTMYPVSRALGTYLFHPIRGGIYHFFSGTVGTDTLWLKISPGSLPREQSTLVFSQPERLSSADSVLAASTGLRQLPLQSATRVFNTKLADSTDGLSTDARVDVVMQIPLISDTLLPEVSIYEKRKDSQRWQRINQVAFELDTLGYVLRYDTAATQFDTLYNYRATVRGVANGLGRFAVLRSLDEQGPMIGFSVGGLSFSNGSVLPRTPEFFANLSDIGGIDRGQGKFYMTLDGDTVSSADVAWSDSLESGGSMTVLFRPSLDPGKHTISVTATDNSGNQSTATATFDVTGDFGIAWALNYPNPFKSSTVISYLLTDITSDYIEIKIYTVSGRHIRTLRELDRTIANFQTMTWDGTDEQGREVANGVYFARLKAKQGKLEVEKTIKMAKIR